MFAACIPVKTLWRFHVPVWSPSKDPPFRVPTLPNVIQQLNENFGQRGGLFAIEDFKPKNNFILVRRDGQARWMDVGDSEGHRMPV